MADAGTGASVVHTVQDQDTARSLGSGDLDVLGTPRLLAWCEEATVAALADRLGPEQTSVGTRVELAHVRATAVGTSVRVRADLVHVDGRLHRFDVVAEQDSDGASAVVAHGQVTRVVVDRDRFLARL
jgi:fluoroacetyl-CoA thioesterase